MRIRVRILTLWENLTSTLWLVPAAMAAASIALAFAMVGVDRATREGFDPWFFLYSGGAEGARSVLSTIAGSMITVAGVVFSSTVVALSFASSQMGPRLLRSFMRDRGNQVVIGTFIATFVYCLLVLRTVRESEPQFVPHLAVTLGLVLALASLAVLIYFIHHVALSLQADYVISIVARELDRAVQVLYPGEFGDDAPAGRLEEMLAKERELAAEKAISVALPTSGHIQALDVDSLMDLAARNDLILHVMAGPGDYVHDGTPVAKIWPASEGRADVAESIASAFILGRARTSQQDVAFAINQLVEVALRALSTGVNDPFTAISCIDRLTTALMHLMRRTIPSRYRVDDGGNLRAIAERPDFDDLIDAAFNQIRHSGAATPSVLNHLIASMGLLAGQAIRDEHRRALDRHATLVRDALRAGVEHEEIDVMRQEKSDRAS